jgi:hypothetical protein
MNASPFRRDNADSYSWARKFLDGLKSAIQDKPRADGQFSTSLAERLGNLEAIDDGERAQHGPNQLCLDEILKSYQTGRCR